MRVLLLVFLLASCGSHEGNLYGFRKGPEEKTGGVFSDEANLEIAVDEGSVAKIESFLGKGLDVNYRFKSTGNTLLIQSVEKNKPRLVKLLLEKGADRAAVNDNGEDAPTLAANTPAILRLFEPPNAEDVASERSALIDSARAGRFSIVRRVLRKGADPNFLSETGEAPLVLAVESGDFNTVKVFFAEEFAEYVHRTDVNFADGSGRRARAVAEAAGHQEIVEFLIEQGAR